MQDRGAFPINPIAVVEPDVVDGQLLCGLQPLKRRCGRFEGEDAAAPIQSLKASDAIVPNIRADVEDRWLSNIPKLLTDISQCLAFSRRPKLG